MGNELRVEGQLLRERVSKSEEEVREKKGMLKAASEEVREARYAVAETEKELGVAQELMKEREVELEKATDENNELLQAKMAAEAENAHMLKELQDLKQS